MNSAVPFLDSQADGFGRFLNREFFGVLSIHDRGVGKGMERVGVYRPAKSWVFSKSPGQEE